MWTLSSHAIGAHRRGTHGIITFLFKQLQKSTRNCTPVTVGQQLYGCKFTLKVFCTSQRPCPLSPSDNTSLLCTVRICSSENNFLLYYVNLFWVKDTCVFSFFFVFPLFLASCTAALDIVSFSISYEIINRDSICKSYTLFQKFHVEYLYSAANMLEEWVFQGNRK